MKTLDGVEGSFEVVWTGVVIIVQEEGQNWSKIRLCAHINPVEAPNSDLILVNAGALVGWGYS